jgi:S1-C subfamily serine protease
MRAVALLSAAILVSGAVGYWASGLRADAPADEAAPISIPVSDEAPSPSSLADTVEKVLPSVVNIKVTSVGFGPFGATERQGEGSGVIIARDGTILTNHHVVEGAVEVKVEFASGRDPLTGTVVGSDADHDVAVVKVEADDLDPLEVGRSADLRLGQTVVALGYPLSLGGPTITQGIVSGLDRSIDVGDPSAGSSESLEGVLQTDAAINPGNSGGPLVDTSGRLVGINTAAASPGSAENIGFATSIDEVLPVVEDILESPGARGAWLGVQISSVDGPEAAAQLSLDEDVRGAYVAGVISGGPAEEAGLTEGSVITELDGDDIDSAEDLTDALDELSAGDEVVLSVTTTSGTSELKVRLGTSPVT